MSRVIAYIDGFNLYFGMKDSGLKSCYWLGMRRFTRLTNGFSKKIENLQAAISLHFLHYNFARIHQTLRVTPAMAAGIADHAWELEEIVGLLG